MKKQVLMVMPVMKGGGAERVAALLTNEFHRVGYETEFVLTSSKKEEVVRTDLDGAIPLVLLKEENVKLSLVEQISRKVMQVYSSVFCKMFEAVKKSVPSHFAYVSFVCQYKTEIKQLREKMLQNPEMTVIAFLQPAIPIVLLAARGLKNRIIISERGNPERLMKHRYGRQFIEKYYNRVDNVVFQTIEAQNTYPRSVSEKGVVISNPIKSDLPEAYHGERNHNITTFCRISKQKNLPLLVDAFAILHKEHPTYVLRIIGDAFNQEGIEVKTNLEEQIERLELTEYVKMEPFSANVHQDIIKDTMYVNSSDYEGISNAMLEAMAIGMPVVCTDCPIGGAHATIVNEVNGMLVSVGDTKALYLAMKRVIEDKKLEQKISCNAMKLRDELSLENTAKKWMELL